jgi:Met-zincin/Domain of unknown function (DUF5117)
MVSRASGGRSGAMRTGVLVCAGAVALGALISMALAQPAPTAPGAADSKPAEAKREDKPDFPPFAEFAKDYQKVATPAEAGESLYTLFRRDKDQGLIAELPRGYASQKHYIAATVASGDTWAGLQGNEVVVYWRRYDKSLALVEPNFETRSTGDAESQSGVAQQFTDRVLLEVPILGMGPSGQPVIDLRALLAGNAQRFFGFSGAGANTKLATIKEAKAFPENIEISIEMPAGGGTLRTFHWSISRLPEKTGYTPREADERVGYFTTTFRDLGKYRDDKKWIRYVNRWQLEKRDPKLKLSPPKQPIVFYIDANVPVRYRRYVREGLLMWNPAFEKIGIADAIEVYYQDKTTGANMDKDPEDVRYNFIRWLANDQGTAIGPSRTDPRTGQILDADIVLTDGWIRYFWYQANELLPEIATQGMSAETLAWLNRNPRWDPRIRLADPAERDYLLAKRSARGVLKYGGHPAGNVDTTVYGDNMYDGLVGRVSQFNGLCLAARGKGVDMALGRMHMELAGLLDEPKDEGKKDDDKKDDKPKKKDENLIDEIPEWFVGPLLADLTAHEVGHTLGLRHNFKASSIYSLDKINSDELKGKKPFGGSVMDYNPVNINRGSGPAQGDYGMYGIGPYDYWAIEYGYTMGDTKDVLKRVSEPELAFLTDEDVGGSDPLARPYDFSANPLEYAQNQMRLVEYYRGRLTDKFVKDGESWAKARRGYLITLSQQMQTLSFMSPWVGGAHVTRARKGDAGARPPIEVVAVEKQRAALKYVMETAFKDEAFGLTPEILKYMTVDKWSDAGGARDIFEESAFPIHDRIMGIQASALTMLMNPTTLKRVYDNELRVPKDQDMITLPEVMNSVSGEIFREIEQAPGSGYSARNPMISSLKRNLQRELLERLVDLTTPGEIAGAASKPISNLSLAKLREIRGKIKNVIEGSGKGNVDDYSMAHLSEAALRIDKVLDAVHIYNTDKIGGGSGGFGFFFGQPVGEMPGGEGAPTMKRYGLEPADPNSR